MEIRNIPMEIMPYSGTSVIRQARARPPDG